jgi:triosephosphate isomerase
MAMNNKLVIGNWKMHGRLERNAALVAALSKAVQGLATEVGVAAPAAYLGQVAGLVANSPLALCAQDVSRYAADGAYTGEVSAEMLADMGVRYVLVGHSERRQYFGEDNAVLRAKLEAALAAGLIPVLCVGETLAEREAGQAWAVIERQLAVLDGLQAGQWVIAYEPVWAIGTGKVATIEQIGEMHGAIAQKLLQSTGGSVKIRVLYGGSVKSDNAEAVLAVPHVDGALVGGASLDAQAFEKICLAAEKLIKYGNS